MTEEKFNELKTLPLLSILFPITNDYLFSYNTL